MLCAAITHVIMDAEMTLMPSVLLTSVDSVLPAGIGMEYLSTAITRKVRKNYSLGG